MCFQGSLNFLLASQTTKTEANLRCAKQPTEALEIGRRELGIHRPAIHARPTALGHTRVNLAPSQPPQNLLRVPHHAPWGLPHLPRGPFFPTTRSPHRAHVGGCAKAARPTSNLLPSPPSPAEVPCHLAAGQAGGRRRRGGDGARWGVRAWRSQGRGCPLG